MVGYILASEIKYAMWIALCSVNCNIQKWCQLFKTIFWSNEQVLVKFQMKQNTIFSQFTHNSPILKFNSYQDHKQVVHVHI